LGNGDGTFAEKTDFGAGDRPVFVAIGDVNGDGRPDLVTANASNTVSVLMNIHENVSVDPKLIPARFALAPPRPNPFGSLATFDISVPSSGLVRIEIYDVNGRRMGTLQNGVLEPGRYTRTWNGTTASGSPARTGVYLVRLTAPGMA